MINRILHLPAVLAGRVRLRAVLLVLALASTALAASGVAAAQGKIPRLANGKPDFSGIWQTTTLADFDLEPHSPREDAPPGPGIVEGNLIPYLPAALEQKKKNFAARATNDPRAKCFSLGVPRQIYYPEPFQILQRERDVTLVPQFGNSVRTIHTNGSLHPEEDNDFWLGDSRGRWEGNTLVVETTNFHPESNYEGSGPNRTVIERFALTDANTLSYEFTVDDATTWTRPWTGQVPWQRDEGPIFEYACHEGNYGMVHLLKGARVLEAEAEAEEAKKPGR